MLLTEAEAKKKWCPKANAHGDSMLRGISRDGNRNWQHTLCIASECMAWRWEAYRGSAVGKGDERRGYCGAFGIPMESIV